MHSTLSRIDKLTALLNAEKTRNLELSNILSMSLLSSNVEDLIILREKYEIIQAQDELTLLIKDYSDIDRAFIFGPTAKLEINRNNRNIPVIIIGDCSIVDAYKFAFEATLKLSRDVSALFYSSNEWAEMLSEHDKFAIRIEEDQKLMLKGF